MLPHCFYTACLLQSFACVCVSEKVKQKKTGLHPLTESTALTGLELQSK